MVEARSRTALLVALLIALGPPALVGQPVSGLERLGGGRLPAAALEGDVILVFFTSWSPRCRDIVPRVNALARKWGTRAPVMLVDFQERPDEVREFLAGRELQVEVLLDQQGTFAKKHAVTTLPSLVVFRDGKVAFRGALTPDPDSVLATVFD